MNQEVKQTIELPEGLASIVVENVNEIKKLQTSIQSLNQKIADVMTGFCLSQKLDLAKESISFSEDFKSINVSDIPVQENVTETNESIKPSKVKRMDSTN